jgi:hypothetical protein
MGRYRAGSRGAARIRGLATLGIAVWLALATAGCGQSTATWPPLGSDDPGPSPVGSVLPGEAPAVASGPDLGEAWTTEPDPESFITLSDGTTVATDQYLVMLDASSTEADAQAVADSVGGSIGGHIEYLGLWKIVVWPSFREAIIEDRLATLASQAGVIEAAHVTLVEVDAAPDCAPGLADAVYDGDNSAPYDMIGVKAAWQALYASGLTINPVHVGFLDTALTRDPDGRIPWEFDDVTFVGEPTTTPDPRAPTEKDPRTDGFHHADGTLGILAGDGQNGGIAGIASPLGTRLLVSHDLLNGPVSAGAPSHWTASDGMTYTDGALLNTLREIETGATVISGSWGGYNQGDARMWKAFFDKMAVEHPDVLFVYSAGNDNKVLDATTHFPGGIPAPNVITVGSEDTDGTKTSYSNKVKADSTGEVTLAAPGDQAVWGTGADGKVRARRGGTSSAAPMVSATAALIRAIDPSLKAADIKKIIADSADFGTRELGNRSLRVDMAIRKAIDDMRAKQIPVRGPLTDAAIAAATAYCQIDVASSVVEPLNEPAGSSRWTVLVSIGTSLRPGRFVDVSLVEDGMRPEPRTQATTAGGNPAAWSILVSADGAWIVATRHDNGYWRKVRLDEAAIPTRPPATTALPTALPEPTAGPSYDCSNPPDGTSSSYLDWWLHCRKIVG